MRAWFLVLVAGCGETILPIGEEPESTVVYTAPTPAATARTDVARADGVAREFFLSELPEAGSIRVIVRVDGLDHLLRADEWVWSDARNSVELVEYVPEAGSTVEITYELVEDHVWQ